MRKLQTTLALAGVAIAAIALIPAFGQWLFPRNPAPSVANPVSPAMDLASPINDSIATASDALPGAVTAHIDHPQDGATVEKLVTVKGTIAGLRPGQKAFLCIKSTAFGRLIFPQGELLPDRNGRWSVSAIYASKGYRYETFVASALDAEAVQVLGDGYNRSYGMRSLPAGSFIIGPVVAVDRR